MKKIAVVCFCLLVPAVGFSLNQPQNLGSVKADVFIPGRATLAQMNALIPDDTGQILIVTDAVNSRVCVSTGAAGLSVAGAWVVGSATGTFVGNSYPHCQ